MAQVITCPYCGKLTDPKLESCPHCGGIVSLADTSARGVSGQQLIGMPKLPAQKCPNCGEMVKSGDIICVKCGTNLLTGQRLSAPTREPKPIAQRDRAPWIKVVVIAALLLGIVVGLFVFAFIFRDKVDSANRLAAQGNFLGAIELLTPYIKKHPNDARAHFALGTYHWKLNQSGEAAESFEKASKLDPSSSRAPIMAVLCLGTSGNVKERQVALLQQAIKADPQNGDAQYLLGLIADTSNQAAIQTDALRAAASLAGANNAAQASLGVALALQGDYANAEAELSKAGNEPVAQTAKGFVSAMSGKNEETQKTLEALVAQPPDGMTPAMNGLILARLGILLTCQGKYEEARKYLNEAMTRTPDNYAAQFYYAICLQAAGSTGDAIREFEAVSQAGTEREPSPFLKDALLCMAELQTSLGNAEKARQALDKASTAGASDSPSYFVTKGRLALISNDVGTARDAFRKAIQLDPQYPGTYLESALLNVKLQMFTEALADLDKYSMLTMAVPGGHVAEEITALAEHLKNMVEANGKTVPSSQPLPVRKVEAQPSAAPGIPAEKAAGVPPGKPLMPPGKPSGSLPKPTESDKQVATPQAGGKAI